MSFQDRDEDLLHCFAFRKLQGLGESWLVVGMRDEEAANTFLISVVGQGSCGRKRGVRLGQRVTCDIRCEPIHWRNPNRFKSLFSAAKRNARGHRSIRNLLAMARHIRQMQTGEDIAVLPFAVVNPI